MTLTLVIWIAFVLTQLADVWTTIKALKQGAVEANPVVAYLMDKTGSAWPFFKLGIASSAAFFSHAYGSIWGVAGIAAITGVVAVLNLRHIK